jgi:DNA-binding IscR family transcriptional regulator
MDQRTERSLIVRRMVIREILSVFHSQDRLTRAELIASCQKVKLDANWLNRLVQAGILTSSRGRNSTYSLAVSNVTILSNFEHYVKKMHNDQVEEHNERRRQAKMTDYRREIKRLKAIIDALGGTY